MLGMSEGQTLTFLFLSTFYFFWLYGGPVLLARLAGYLYAQPWVRADSRGLYYGTNYVPWAAIEGAQNRRTLVLRRDRQVLLAPSWSGGVIQRIVRRHGLPLSRFDPKWKENERFVAALRANLSLATLASLGIAVDTSEN